MHGTPDAPNRLIIATHNLPTLDPSQLLSTCISEQFYFLQNLLFLEIPNAYGLLPTIDISTTDDGMFGRPGGDVYFDLRVRGSK